MADDTLTSTLTDSQAAQALPVTQPQIPQQAPALQAPDLPRFQRTFGNTLKSMLVGLGEGGVLGAAFGAVNPAAIERQQQQRQQVISSQTAEAVAKAHVAQMNAAALPGKLRDEHDKAVDEHVKFMTDIYGPPDEVIPNTSEAAQAALQNHLGNGNVPLAHIASNSDSIFAWHAGAASANSANLDIVHQAGILSGNPAFRNMTFQQYGALKPDEREQLFVKAGGILSPVTPDPDPVARARQLLDAQRQLQTVQSLPGGKQKDQLLTLAQNNMDFLSKADKAYADAGITSARQKGQQAGVEAIEAQPGKTQAQISGETTEAATPKGQLATQKTKSEIAEATAQANLTNLKARQYITDNTPNIFGDTGGTSPLTGEPMTPKQADSSWSSFNNKTLQPLQTSTEKSFRMAQAAFNEYQASGGKLPTGAQSMLLLSQHLSTTFGTVKGSRVTKDMIAEHLNARGITDKAAVAVQSIVNGDQLSPDQWTAFMGLIGQSREFSFESAIDNARANGIGKTIPAWLPKAPANGTKIDPSTARIYKYAAHGDSQKAVTAAQQAGWSVQ